MAQRHRSTIVIRDIDPDLVAKQHAQGQFQDLRLSSVPPSKVICNAVNLLRNQHLESCTTFKGVHNTKVSLFNIDPPKNAEQACSRECFWDHHVFDNEPVGLPITMAQDKKCDSEGNQCTHYAFETKYQFCSFECMYAFFTFSRSSNNRSNWIANDTERMIHKMYGLLFPGKKLRAAPDWLHLIRFSGHLSIKQFRQDQHQYYPIHHIQLTPISHEYIKTEVDN